jgi:hypothetical protein
MRGTEALARGVYLSPDLLSMGPQPGTVLVADYAMEGEALLGVEPGNLHEKAVRRYTEWKRKVRASIPFRNGKANIVLSFRGHCSATNTLKDSIRLHLVAIGSTGGRGATRCERAVPPLTRCRCVWWVCANLHTGA